MRKSKKSPPLVTLDLVVGLTSYNSAASFQSPVTAGDTLWNISPGPNRRTDIEIIDSSPQQNVYLRKKVIKPGLG